MYCTNCSAKLEPDEYFCPNCGAPVDHDPEAFDTWETIATKKRKTRKVKKILLVVVSLTLVVAILAGVFVAVLLNGENDPQKGVSSEALEESEGEENLRVVPPEVAALFGVDPNETDSDGDGLSNYTEIYESGTHPAMVDTDENGVVDGDEDADGDGLTNMEEVLHGTNLSKKDTDTDGLSDFAEINEFNTYPAKYDTDGDTLGDGDEIELGLNPLVQKTDGTTLDSSRKFTQQLSAEKIDDSLTSEDSLAVPSLILTAMGNINSRVEIAETDSAVFGDSRAVVGSAIDISGQDLGEGTLSFSLKEDLKVECEYGYQTSLICKYNEDGSTEYLETGYDSATHSLSADLSGEGTYFVLDVENLFDELGLAMPASSGVSASGGSVGVMAQADIIFLIDTTSSMEDEINHVKNNVGYFVDALKAKGVTTGLALIDYQDLEADGYDSTRVHKSGLSNWFYDVDAYKRAIDALDLGWGGDYSECAIDALETGRLLDMRPSAGKIFILVTDADYKVDNRYEIPSMEVEIELLKNAGVTCAVVSSSRCASSYYNLYTETNGIWADIDGDFYTELMRLADKIGTDIVGDGYWIYLDGPVPAPVRLDAEPVAGSTVDTDKDGIPDVEELAGAEPTEYIDLDALLTRVSCGVITGTDYGMVMMYEYKSNPAEEDTDYDGIPDSRDSSPIVNTFTGTLKMSEYSPAISYTMDFRDFFNDNNLFNRDLSQTSLIFSAVMYNNGMLNYDEEAGLMDSKINQEIASYHLNNVVCYDLRKGFSNSRISLSQYFDDDVSEVIFGHKKVVYNGQTKEIVAVFVRGTNGTIEEWSSNFDLGDKSRFSEYDDWKNDKNHKGFDTTANRIYAALQIYVGEYLDDTSVAYWLTGHSRGAAIGNIVSAMLIDDGQEVFSYLFAVPNTTVSDSAHDDKYDAIFNCVNKNDFVTCMPMSQWGFKRYGRSTSSLTITKDTEKKWEKFTGALDYNDISQKSLDKLVSILAECSPDGWDSCYLYTCDCTHGNHTDNTIIEKGVEIDTYEQIIQNCRPGQYCYPKIYSRPTGQKQYQLCQIPAYFMQVLAELMAEQYGLGMNGLLEQAVEVISVYSLADRYEDARNEVLWAVAKGIKHQHYTETYYILNQTLTQYSFE